MVIAGSLSRDVSGLALENLEASVKLIAEDLKEVISRFSDVGDPKLVDGEATKVGRVFAIRVSEKMWGFHGV